MIAFAPRGLHSTNRQQQPETWRRPSINSMLMAAWSPGAAIVLPQPTKRIRCAKFVLAIWGLSVSLGSAPTSAAAGHTGGVHLNRYRYYNAQALQTMCGVCIANTIERVGLRYCCWRWCALYYISFHSTVQ